MASSINTLMGGREWLMLLTLSLLWGGSFFFIGVAVLELKPLMIVALRLGIAASVLWGIVFSMKLFPVVNLKLLGVFLCMGILNNVIPFVLIVWGQTQIASGLASILNAATPIFTVVVAGLMLNDERATPLKLLGVIIGFLGVVIILGMPNSNDDNSFLAQLAIVAAALSYALAGVYGRRFKAMSIYPMITAAGQVTASFFVIFPICMLVDNGAELDSISIEVWGAIAGLSVLSTAMAYVLYFKILASSGATNLLLVTLLIPVSAILLGWLFLDEKLVMEHFVGMGLIALGLSVVDGRIWMRKKPPNA